MGSRELRENKYIFFLNFKQWIRIRKWGRWIWPKKLNTSQAVSLWINSGSCLQTYFRNQTISNMEMHLHTRNISAAAMYMKEQRSTQLKILVVGIAGIKLQKVRLSVIYDRVRNRKNNFEIPDFLNFWMENLKSGKFKWKQTNTSLLPGRQEVQNIPWIFLLMIFHIQLAERRYFKINFWFCNLPYITLVRVGRYFYW